MGDISGGLPATPHPTRRDRAVVWVLHYTPTAILLNPERVALKAGVALIGLVSLVFIRPTSLTALLPHWVPYLWGATWLLGGVFGLAGYWRSSRKLEMAGHRLIILGAVVYGVAIIASTGAQGIPGVILVWVLVACPSLIRLLIAAGASLSRGHGR